jgi:protein-S-isoprenylcysteine O-methyltransferase Ste14
MTPRKINPPHYFLFALVAMALLRLWPTPAVLDAAGLDAAWRWLGLAPIVAGVAIAAWASRQFARAGTSILPLTRSSALVTDGAFAYSRNPMYLGMTLVLVGAALLLNRPGPWLVPPGFVAILYLRFIRHEERLMEATFGDAYRAYCARVRRFV